MAAVQDESQPKTASLKAPAEPPRAGNPTSPPERESLLSQGIASQPERSKDECNTGTRNTKRRPLNLGNKKSVEMQESSYEAQAMSAASNPTTPFTVMRPVSPLNSPDLVQPSASPHRARHQYRSPSSPARTFRSSSPRMHSPASSQIFERSVQEDIIQASPSIPSHIITENHIPPILEASSAAITDDRLDPDSVEIITHSMHQPAAFTVTGTGTADHSIASSWHEDVGTHTLEPDDSASNYGALDSTDIKRLSFISFADVVHAEHAESGEQFSNRDSLYIAGLSSNPATLAALNRSPSPVRSPVSSHGVGTSPPTSVSPSFKGLETSPSRAGRGPGSPLLPAHSPLSSNFSGELNVETMRQALRRTGSGDLGGIRSLPLSAVGNDDGTYDRPIK